jgi:alpha,alpha-trehalose phosphorylase
LVASLALQNYGAVLFDLDGVLTTTRTVHAAAWKRTIDEYLSGWDARHGTRTARFDDRADYATYVDGKPRQEGVRDFLASRGIALPEGDPDASPDEESCGAWAIASR